MEGDINRADGSTVRSTFSGLSLREAETSARTSLKTDFFSFVMPRISFRFELMVDRVRADVVAFVLSVKTRRASAEGRSPIISKIRSFCFDRTDEWADQIKCALVMSSIVRSEFSPTLELR